MSVPTSVLARPRHPVVEDALRLARLWCGGHVIDNAPALAHAVRVAVVLGRHVPDPAPQLVAAALLHDAPEYAPAGIDLDTLLTTRLGPAVTTVVRGMQREHEALAGRTTTDLSTADRWTLHASAADKIVSLRSILGRAERTADPADYWATRAAFLHRVGYFRAFHTVASAHLPERMSTDLARLVTVAEHAAATFASKGPPPPAAVHTVVPASAHGTLAPGDGGAFARQQVQVITTAGKQRSDLDRPTTDGAQVFSMAAHQGRHW